MPQRRPSVQRVVSPPWVLVAGWLLVATNLACGQGSGAVEPAPDAALLAVGQRIYREGLLASGERLVALGAAQTRLTGKDVACAACHRRSGFGGSEGRFAIRPIIGPALLQEQTVVARSPRIKAQLGSSVRPPYSEALLDRAIRSGIDAAGRPLDPVMPRYALSAQEMKALSAYLFLLSAQPSPGVDEQEIHFATVIQPGVAPQRRQAMLDVMQAFVKDKGANVRSEEQRRDAGTMRMYRAYRKWVLHVWELTGPSEAWGAQLEAFYRQQPVFALIGGLGGASWRPIHEFSERFEIPSVFPLADLPVVTGPNTYSVYFSRGITLEAEVLARFLREPMGSPAGKVVQVRRADEAGTAAANTLRVALADAGVTLEDHVLEGPADETFWRTVADANAAALVLWLGASDLTALPALTGVGVSPTVYLSFGLLGGARLESAVRSGADIRLVYPSDLSPRHETRLLRNKLWLHNKGIVITDETVQVNTQFAMTVVSDVIGHIADSF